MFFHVKMFLIMFLFRDSISFWSPKWRFAVVSRMCSWYRWVMLNLGINFSCFSFFLIALCPTSGIHPEEYSHIQSCCEEHPGSSHRPEQLSLPGRVSIILMEARIRRCLLWILILVVLLSALEAWRSTTAMGRSKCPTPWRAGWN